MSYAQGYLCLLSCDTLCQVPQTASELPLLFQLLSSVLRMKVRHYTFFYCYYSRCWLTKGYYYRV